MTGQISEEAIEEICFFGSSISRLHVLGILQDQEATLNDLKCQTEASHSTIVRAVNDLKDESYITTEANSTIYRASELGSAIYDYLREVCEYLEQVTEFKQFYKTHPGSIPVCSGAMGSIKVTCSTQTEPFRPTYRLAELIRGAKSVKLFNITSSPAYISVIGSILGSDTIDLELTITEDTAMVLNDQQSVNELQSVGEQNHKVNITDATCGFGIALIDSKAILVSYRSGQVTEALLEVEEDGDELYDYICQTYAEFVGDDQEIAPKKADQSVGHSTVD